MWRDRDENGDPETDLEQEPESSDMLELGVGDRAFSLENESVDAENSIEEWVEYPEAEPEASATGDKVEIAILAILAVAWTTFFLWVNRDIFATLVTANAGTEMLAQWCMPIILLGIFHLLYMRNSSREANRFADVSSSLRSESEQLESRLKTVNNELSIARAFLASETRELEFLGDQSSQKLTTAAKQIKSALEDGLSDMRKLDDVGESAFKNLDQLREHLPVVINTAKDVTNQIGNSGRVAQTEMAAMVATLKKVGEVGTSAKKSIDDLTESSQQSLDKLSQTAEQIKISFSKQFADAENETQRISKLLEGKSAEIIEALQKTRSELAEDTSVSTAAISADLDALENAISKLAKTADHEEARLQSLIENLQDNIAKANDDVASLDNDSGEKTAKLAFALKALEEHTASLQRSLKQGHGVADGMIERIDKLLVALDSTTREMDETLPAAFARLDERSQSSLSVFKLLSREAEMTNKTAGGVAEQLERSGSSITAQQDKLSILQNSGTAITEDMIAQIDALSGSLKEVQNQNEALAESAGEKLINALLRVKETAKQASEHSRETLENSIAGSTQKFEQVSEEALNRIIDEKIASIAPKLEEAVSHAVATTQNTAGHLTDQLSAIEEMTTNLEQRILFAKEKAEQSSDENFTRRVALLTESLNSTAIDVSKILSNDVTDTEWAAYLKGDRGIFTRRAVRLLDNGEVREILAQYDADDEFREHVNRYIHDFEAMLRGVLSTRDGSAISVTLLSSDIGKLYVALAQAIERLRS